LTNSNLAVTEKARSMQNVLLLTDYSPFYLMSRELGVYSHLKFDYLVMNHKGLTNKESAENDFNRILNACAGKDVVILQMSGNKVIYLLDVLLRAGEFDCHRFILVQSPLIDFYYRPVEDFYVDKALRRKLEERAFKVSVVRPLTAYFMPYLAARLKKKPLTQMSLLSEVSVYRQILSDLEEDTGWGKTRYFLPEAFAEHHSMLKRLKMREKIFFHLLLLIGGLKQPLLYQQLLEEDALYKLMGKIKGLQEVLYIRPAMHKIPG
jgi:hypothetical protein